MEKSKRRPNIHKTKEKFWKNDLFYFRHENCDNENCDKILKIIQNLHSKKTTRQGDIPVRITKENKFVFSKLCLKSLIFVLTIMDFKKLTLSLFTRRIKLLKKLITDQLLYQQYYRYLLNVAARSNLWVYR